MKKSVKQILCITIDTQRTPAQACSGDKVHRFQMVFSEIQFYCSHREAANMKKKFAFALSQCRTAHIMCMCAQAHNLMKVQCAFKGKFGRI